MRLFCLCTPRYVFGLLRIGVLSSLLRLYQKTMKTTNVLSGEFTKLPVLFSGKRMFGSICAFVGVVLLEMGYILSHGSVAPFMTGSATVSDNIIVGCLGVSAVCCMLNLILETSLLWADTKLYPKRPLRWVIAGAVAGVILGMIFILNYSIGSFDHMF